MSRIRSLLLSFVLSIGVICENIGLEKCADEAATASQVWMFRFHPFCLLYASTKGWVAS